MIGLKPLGADDHQRRGYRANQGRSTRWFDPNRAMPPRMDERRSNKPKVDGSALSLTPSIRELPLDPPNPVTSGYRVTVLHQGERKILLCAQIDRATTPHPPSSRFAISTQRPRVSSLCSASVTEAKRWALHRVARIVN